MKQLALLQELESPAVHGVLCTEAEVCLAGLQVEIAHGISHVYVEIDSLLLVTTLKSSDYVVWGLHPSRLASTTCCPLD